MEKFLIYLVLMSIALNAEAALVPVNNDGATVASGRYLMMLTNREEAEKVYNNSVLSSASLGGRISVDGLMVPAKSNLTVGKVKSRLVETSQLPRPMFLIGGDQYSIKWAAKNSSVLKRIHAIGFITNVDNLTEVKRIEKRTQLTLIPVSLNGIDKYLPVHHYPFLWTNKDVEQ